MEGKEGLSPEELAAMEGEDETQTDELLASVAGEGDEAVSGEEEGKSEKEPEGKAPVTEDGDKPGVPSSSTSAETVFSLPELGETEEIEVPADIPPVRFRFRDDGKVLPEFKDQFTGLDARYDEGDITLSEYNEQRDALKAQMNNAKADVQLWTAECETFWQHNKEWRLGTPLGDMLNGEVIRLAASEKAAGLSGIELIYAAKERVSQALDSVRGRRQIEAETKPATLDGKKRPASPRPAAATHALGTAPAAAPAEVGQGEFAHLDNLQGLDLEAAVASMTPEQRDRWTRET